MKLVVVRISCNQCTAKFRQALLQNGLLQLAALTRYAQEYFHSANLDSIAAYCLRHWNQEDINPQASYSKIIRQYRRGSARFTWGGQEFSVLGDKLQLDIDNDVSFHIFPVITMQNLHV